MSRWFSINFIIFWSLISLHAQKPKDDPGLIKFVQPNFKAVKGLICYQCRSITSDNTPLCDKSLFKLTTPQEKNNMSLQCPDYQGAFCFTKVTQKGKYRETKRGCSGSTDKNENLLKSGCMTKKNQVICLCDTKFCNKAILISRSFGVYVIFIILIRL